VKSQFWSNILRLTLFFIGIFCFKFSIFDQGGEGWGRGRILMIGAGIFFLMAAMIISLPQIIGLPDRAAKLEKFSHYLILAPLWCLLSLVLIELILRATIYNPPLYINSSNWSGDIPAANSAILWGQEGYAITHYGKWREVQTPYADDRMDNSVIVLGDSLTEGFQVADSRKFSSIAETMLRQNGYDIDVHNLGRSGLAMGDYVSWIPIYQSLYQPKVIVIQLTRSDFVDSFSLDQFNYFIARNDGIIDLFHAYDISSGFSQKVRKNINWGGSQIQLLGSERWHLIQQSMENLIDENPVVEVSNTETGGQVDAFNTDLAAQQMEMLISESGDVPLIVVLLPSTPYISGNELLLADPEYEEFKDFIKGFPEITIVDPLPEFQQLASNGHLPRGFFNSVPGGGHLNMHGHEIIGQMVADAIQQVLK
jgi:lysophospholipase L1-like esterase